MTPKARVLLIAVLCVVVIAIVLGWDHIRLATEALPEREGAAMLIVAHRGNVEEFPEDSAEGIWDAARVGADAIEFDVHQSRDGTWWVIHDASVDRTTDGGGAVRALPDTVLETLHIDAGPGFRDEERASFGLATLRSILDGLDTYAGELFVDMQHTTEADPAGLARHLAGYRATIICRTVADAELVKQTDASIRTLLRIDRLDGEAESVDSVLVEAFREVSADTLDGLTRPAVTYVDEKAGFNDEERLLRRAWAVGVDAFLTKRLASAIALRDELAAGTGVAP